MTLTPGVEYDALLVLSFGGPEGPDEVLPFLENVTRGRGIPRERLLEVSQHYFRFGGVSPINARVRELCAGIEGALAEEGLGLRLYQGNRNWHPMLTDTVRRMADDGVRRALVLVTSAFGSYSGCRQYLDDLSRARAEVGERAPVLDKLRLYFDHPGFLEPVIEHARDALASLDPALREHARLVMTAHSVPTSMASTSPYEAQLRAASEVVACALGKEHAWELAWQSRSGPPEVPWLEPDVGDRLEALAKEGTRAVVLVPIGFVADHMEVVWDLDHAARERADAVGLAMARARTVNAHPRFVSMVTELVKERVAGAPRHALTTLGPAPDACRADCCPAPARRPSR